MPVDPLSLALMAVNVGASVFNNWRNNKQSHKLQEKQQEFARAAAERNKQRMWQLMREGQELALEMERETHENRLVDIRNDFDHILHRLAYAQAINSWPLKVLPIVMKNQSLGSLTATADENIAMHCILTPSNCAQFNKHILPTIEEKLADFCNLHWSTLSSHPILFYSGAWKTGTMPTGVEVSQLKTNLSNLPTLLITPFFEPEGGMVFQINAWGIGVELKTEIECADFSYAESYKQGIDYLQEEDIKERTIEEFIPYLQCLIGYIADQYFWTNHNESPLLPTLLAMNVVNTDGMQYLNIASEERYSNLLDVCKEESQAMPFSPEKMLNLLEGSASLWDETTRKNKLEEIFITNAQRRSNNAISSMNEALSCEFYSKEDLPFLRKFIEIYQYCDYKDELSNLLQVLESIDFDYSILESTDIAYLEKLANEGSGAAMFRLGEIYEYSIGVDYDKIISDKYYESSLRAEFILAEEKQNIKIGGNVNVNTLHILHDSGVISSSIMLSELYLTDNLDYSIHILNSLAENQHPRYLYIGARALKQKYGNYEKESVVSLLKDAADNGYNVAQLELMYMYKNGDFVQENPELHFRYASMAAEQGNIEAMTIVGLCFFTGYGTIKSIDSALRILNIPANKGYSKAIKLLNIINSI
ncbi:MAG: sel1 repeat family protein [Bacteroidales bacterium]|nr:sel1 repeat family protein [Bacteroidales bacterium]